MNHTLFCLVEKFSKNLCLILHCLAHLLRDRKQQSYIQNLYKDTNSLQNTSQMYIDISSLNGFHLNIHHL